MFFSNNNVRTNLYLKELLLNHLSYSAIEKINISVLFRNVIRVFDYRLLQSICLLDVTLSQKPVLSMSKIRYNLGSKSFTFKNKVSLRNSKMFCFLQMFNFIYLSEMRKRYVSANFGLTSGNQLSFAFKIPYVFPKLDSFYYNWNFPIGLTFVFSKILSYDAVISYFINFNFFVAPYSLSLDLDRDFYFLKKIY